jgi:hypothetical protein
LVSAAKAATEKTAVSRRLAINFMVNSKYIFGLSLRFYNGE